MDARACAEMLDDALRDAVRCVQPREAGGVRARASIDELRVTHNIKLYKTVATHAYATRRLDTPRVLSHQAGRVYVVCRPKVVVFFAFSASCVSCLSNGHHRKCDDEEVACTMC